MRQVDFSIWWGDLSCRVRHCCSLAGLQSNVLLGQQSKGEHAVGFEEEGVLPFCKGLARRLRSTGGRRAKAFSFQPTRTTCPALF